MMSFIKFTVLFLALVVMVVAGFAAFQGNCSHFTGAVVGNDAPTAESQACTCLGYELYTIDLASQGGYSQSICLGFITSVTYRNAASAEQQPVQ
jgi:hypothetical protein